MKKVIGRNMGISLQSRSKSYFSGYDMKVNSSKDHKNSKYTPEKDEEEKMEESESVDS
jgi:hypothetical protein